MQRPDSEVNMPVTVQQIAAAIHRMNAAERQELLQLVPELLAKASIKDSTAGPVVYNFDKARKLLGEIKGDLSDSVSQERDERG